MSVDGGWEWVKAFFEFVVLEGFGRVSFRRYFSKVERYLSLRSLSGSETALRPHQCMGSKHIPELERAGLWPWAKRCGTKQPFLLNFGNSMQAQPFTGRVSEPWDGSFALPKPHSLPTSLLQEAAALCLWEGAACLPSKKKGVNFLSFVLCKGEN